MINIPNPPYPRCKFYKCKGTRLPIVGAETQHFYQDCTAYKVPNTFTLSWICDEYNNHKNLCKHEKVNVSSFLGFFKETICENCMIKVIDEKENLNG